MNELGTWLGILWKPIEIGREESRKNSRPNLSTMLDSLEWINFYSENDKQERQLESTGMATQKSN